MRHELCCWVRNASISSAGSRRFSSGSCIRQELKLGAVCRFHSWDFGQTSHLSQLLHSTSLVSHSNPPDARDLEGPDREARSRHKREKASDNATSGAEREHGVVPALDLSGGVFGGRDRQLAQSRGGGGERAAAAVGEEKARDEGLRKSTESAALRKSTESAALRKSTDSAVGGLRRSTEHRSGVKGVQGRIAEKARSRPLCTYALCSVLT